MQAGRKSVLASHLLTNTLLSQASKDLASVFVWRRALLTLPPSNAADGDGAATAAAYPQR